jgi:hypothetical protein
VEGERGEGAEGRGRAREMERWPGARKGENGRREGKKRVVNREGEVGKGKQEGGERMGE